MSVDLTLKSKRSGRLHRDKTIKYALAAVSSAAAAIILFIIVFIVANSAGAVSEIGIWEFLTGSIWRPSTDTYGAFPVIIGTLLVTLGAVLFAVPLGIGSAIFISEVVPEKIRNILKPLCEIFAGIPSVVYGFFGIIILVPLMKEIFPSYLDYGYSWLTGSILLGIMALPTIISVSDDAMRSVPKAYREASMSIGATRWETTRKIVIPSALSGISAAVILGIGRAIGETMAVMMVTGNTAVVPDPLWNVFDMVRTITATLALEMPNVVVGSTHYSALFLLALILMIMVFAINACAKIIVKKTQMKFAGNGESRFEKYVPESVSKFADKYAKTIKRTLILTVFLVISYMIISLFITPLYAALSALALAAGFEICKTLGKRLASMQREKIAHCLCGAAVAVIIAILAVLLGNIIIKGIPALSFEFLTSYPSNAGLEGGIYPAIVGTLKLIAGTLIIAFPLGVISAVYLAEYSQGTRYAKVIKSAIEILNGTPSVVFGLFGMSAIVIYLGIGYSLIGGCITLAFLVLPVIIKTTEEAILTVPHELREASMAMGASKWETTCKVVLPAAFGGILTGVILSLGRAAGETAPIMFTAVIAFQSSTSSSIFDPIMALPYHLYYLASEVAGSELNQYGTALVLLIIVLSMFVTASVVRHIYAKKMRW